jgi:hypothetical protein
MFISKEKFDALLLQLTNAQTARQEFLTALSLTEEATNEEALTAIQSLQTTITESETALQSSKDGITAVVNSLDDLGASVKEAADPIAKIEAVKVLLAAKPGSSATHIAPTEDNVFLQNGGPDWKTINELPHNKEADQNQI